MLEPLLVGASHTQPSSRAHRLGRLWRSAAAGLALAAAAASAQTPSPVIEVQAGDTFSGIAAQFSGQAATWRKMYRAELSGVRDPNRIQVGMRFEIATDAHGDYLRLVGTGVASKAAPAAPAATQSAASTAASPTPAVSAGGARAAPETPAAVPAPPAPVARAAGDVALVIGVLPNVAAATLAAQYQSMQRYIERVTGRKVRVVVPASFKAFFDSTMAGEFDLAVAAPHLARVAQLDRSLIPLVAYEPVINALFVAPSNSSITGPRDVRERAVVFANPQSLVAMYGQQWLRQQNMEPGRDYEVKAARTDLGVGRMLLSSEATAAIMSNGEFRLLPSDESARLKIVEVFARIPNFIVLAHPRLPSDQQASLKAQLKSFLTDKADGVPFAQATGFTAIVDVDDKVLRELDSFVVATRRAMGYAK